MISDREATISALALLGILLWTAPALAADADADGVPSETDCNDADPAVRPGATEVCNGKDDDCDKSIDESDAADAVIYYADVDKDGYGVEAKTARACKAPVGFVARPGDCNDAKAGVNPGAEEVCDAGNVDEDCDGKADDLDDAPKGRTNWYVDADSDGVGTASAQSRCDAGAGFTVLVAGDCNDGDATIKPGAVEVCDAANVDEDCDGTADDADASATKKTSWYADKDADGHGAGAAVARCDASAAYPVSVAGDCVDTAANVHPGAVEVCDAGNVDEDCDGKADDLDTEATGKAPFYADKDLDKYGAGEPQLRCDASASYPATVVGDCDDARAAVKPGAVEVCDAANVDEDCDGKADDADTEAQGRVSFYADTDGDGFGSGSALAQCDPSAAYPVKSAGDCDDRSASVKPGAVEVCDAANVDEDCDGAADDADPSATQKTRFYADKDADTFGAGAGMLRCDASFEWPVSEASDCNDAVAGVHPGAVEVCDARNVDEDCDGKADDLDTDATGKATYYADRDADKYGSGQGAAQCDPSPAFAVTAGGDCDDAKAGVHPGATEVCDAGNIDEDCDGRADDLDDGAQGKVSFYADADADGVGAGEAFAQCDASAAHPVKGAGDCNDRDAAIKPGAVEVCDGGDVDEDCDGKADDADTSATGKTSWYADRDADGYGAGAASPRCDASAAYPVSSAGDCNDGSAGVHPGAVEVCDAANIDEDCSGAADNADEKAKGRTSFYADRDGDKFGAGAAMSLCDANASFPVVNADDCDDARATVNPKAVEVCDAANVDEDCDGRADDLDDQAGGKVAFYEDADRDGYGGASADQCDASAKFSIRQAGDCNDRDPSVSPAAAEVCDAGDVDEDCDGKSDNSDPSATGRSGYFADRDGDNYGTGAAVSLCDPTPAAKAARAGDCNDGNASVNPGEAEVCDDANVDEDCDGKSDNGDPDATGLKSWYADADRDGYGSGTATRACDSVGTGSSNAGGDCNDADRNVNPGAAEVCDANDVDEDCDGSADDADPSVSPASKGSYYEDRDGDGYGRSADAESRCDAVPGRVSKKDDCDDAVPYDYPGAPELCDGRPNDCTPAASWSESREAGAISAKLDGGQWVDLRGTFPSSAPATPPAPWEAPAGAVLHVCQGDHYGRAVVNSGSFTLIGRGGADGARLGGVSGGSILDVGGAVKSVDVRDVTLFGGDASFGGAIRLQGKTALTLTGASFVGNRASAGGGALYVTRPTSVTITGGAFVDNRSGSSGGGIGMAPEASGGKLVVEGTVFAGNEAVSHGGGIDTVMALDLRAASFQGNKARAGAGLACRNAACGVDAVAFDGNVASGQGGGVYMVGNASQKATVTNGVFNGNKSGGGGGLYLSGVDAQVNSSRFDANWGGTGGALLVDSGTVVVSDGAFTQNIGGGSNGGNGGAVYQSSGDLTLHHCGFDRNEAQAGAGRGDGGAVYVPGGTLSVVEGTFTANQAAGSGGAMYVGLATVRLERTNLEGNLAARGGGVYQTGPSSIVQATGLRVQGNQAVARAPLSAQGGGWFLSAGARAVLDAGSLVGENVARTDSARDSVLGGGIAALGSGTAIACFRSSVAGNQATGSGAAGQVVLGGGAYVGQGAAVLESESCDWGSDATDNGPTDVWVDAPKEPFSHTGTSGTFKCAGDKRACE